MIFCVNVDLNNLIPLSQGKTKLKTNMKLIIVDKYRIYYWLIISMYFHFEHATY